MSTLEELLTVAKNHYDDVEYAHPGDLNLETVYTTRLSDYETDWASVPVLRIRNAYGEGDLIDRSNYRSLRRDFGEDAGLRDVGYEHGTGLLVILSPNPKVIGSEDWDEVARESLWSELLGLYDYPIYDENDWSELEVETDWQCWEDYGRIDLMLSLDRGGYGDLSDVADDVIDEAFLAWRESAGVWVEFDEGYAYWPGLDTNEARAYIAAHITDHTR